MLGEVWCALAFDRGGDCSGLGLNQTELLRGREEPYVFVLFFCKKQQTALFCFGLQRGSERFLVVVVFFSSFK